MGSNCGSLDFGCDATFDNDSPAACSLAIIPTAAGVMKSVMRQVLIATSNPGKLRDFAGAAAHHGVEIAAIPNFSSLPAVFAEGLTFEADARHETRPHTKHIPC